jgi:hypothetical protein
VFFTEGPRRTLFSHPRSLRVGEKGGPDMSETNSCYTAKAPLPAKAWEFHNYEAPSLIQLHSLGSKVFEGNAIDKGHIPLQGGETALAWHTRKASFSYPREFSKSRDVIPMQWLKCIDGHMESATRRDSECKEQYSKQPRQDISQYLAFPAGSTKPLSTEIALTNKPLPRMRDSDGKQPS